jgi:hypothetical protein
MEPTSPSGNRAHDVLDDPNRAIPLVGRKPGDLGQPQHACLHRRHAIRLQANQGGREHREGREESGLGQGGV